VAVVCRSEHTVICAVTSVPDGTINILLLPYPDALNSMLFKYGSVDGVIGVDVVVVGGMVVVGVMVVIVVVGGGMVVIVVVVGVVIGGVHIVVGVVIGGVHIVGGGVGVH